MGNLILISKNLKRIKDVFFLISMSLILSACFRGTPSEETAIHLNPNMDDQERYDAQEKSTFFADSRTMRMPVEGTIARGEFYEDDALYLGKDDRGNWLKTLPLMVTPQFMERGRERYDIFCAPCHSLSGDGKSIIVKKGFLPPPSFHEEKVIAYYDGYIYEVISNGVRNMPDYKKQIPVNDRWAIVAYVRALQRTQNASVNDVPEDKLNELN